ncbi:unnamed protein product [Auanema sp. JU1783]|nr:unnamed protein product [Auanema sp. JU1783]
MDSRLLEEYTAAVGFILTPNKRFWDMINYTRANIHYDYALKTISTFHFYLFSLAVLINPLTFFIVFNYTSKSFGNIRFYILTHQFLNICEDFALSGFQSFGFFPLCAFETTGPLAYYFPGGFKTSAIFFSFATLTVSTSVGAVFYRFQCLIDHSSLFKIRKERHIRIGLVVISLTSGIFAYFSFVHGEDSLVNREARLSVNSPEMVVFSKTGYADHCIPNFVPFISSVIFFEAVLNGWGAIFVFGCIHYLYVENPAISRRTKYLQKKFTIFLMIQFLVPVVMAGIPWTYTIIAICWEIFHEYSYICNLIAYMSLSMHSLVYSLVTLATTDNYRNYLLSFIRIKRTISTNSIDPIP